MTVNIEIWSAHCQVRNKDRALLLFFWLWHCKDHRAELLPRIFLHYSLSELSHWFSQSINTWERHFHVNWHNVLPSVVIGVPDPSGFNHPQVWRDLFHFRKITEQQNWTVVLFCTVWTNKSLQILALCCHGDQNYTHQSHICQICNHIWIQLHVDPCPEASQDNHLLSNLGVRTCGGHTGTLRDVFQNFTDLGSVAPVLTSLFEQNTGLSHQLLIWVSTDEHFGAKRSGLLFNSKNSHRCMLWTEPGPIKRWWL